MDSYYDMYAEIGAEKRDLEKKRGRLLSGESLTRKELVDVFTLAIRMTETISTMHEVVQRQRDELRSMESDEYFPSHLWGVNGADKARTKRG